MLRVFFNLFRFYCTLLLLFALQKPLFMLYNAVDGYSVGDYFDVMLHGILLDSAMAAYLTAVPLLLIIVAQCMRQTRILNAIWRIYSLIAAAFISLMFVVDTALYGFWQYKLDASVLLYLGTPGEALASVSWWYLTIGIVLLIILTILSYYILRQKMPIVAVKNRILTVALSILVGGILFLLIRGGWKESTSNVGQVYYSSDQFLNHSAVNPAFSFLSSISKTEDLSQMYRFFTEEERKELMSGLYNSTQNAAPDTTSIAEKPNIILIVLEGFPANLINDTVAPNLTSLARDAVSFTNCYANSFRTDRGLVSLLSGYFGFPEHSVMKMPAKSRHLPGLAQTLREEGYTTEFIYGGDINFTNMQGYLYDKGYQSVVSDRDFHSSRDKHQEWGAADEAVFDYAYRRILAADQNPTPNATSTFTTILTLSSHEPFDVPYHRLAEPIPNAFAYADSCLGAFLHNIEQLPSYRNTLVVITADHGFYYPREGYARHPKYFRIPLVLLHGSGISLPPSLQSNGQYDMFCNQSDIAATLLSLLGMPHDDFHFSRNILSADYKAPFAYYAFNKGMALIDSTGYTVFDLTTDKIVEQSSPNATRERRAKAVLQTSYHDLSLR